jgi:hypothetical protein
MKVFYIFFNVKEIIYLIESIRILEFGINFNEDNIHFKILLTRIYSIIGSVNDSYDYFKKLDVKHTLFESLSFLSFYDILKLPGIKYKFIIRKF